MTLEGPLAQAAVPVLGLAVLRQCLGVEPHARADGAAVVEVVVVVVEVVLVVEVDVAPRAEEVHADEVVLEDVRVVEVEVTGCGNVVGVSKGPRVSTSERE